MSPNNYRSGRAWAVVDASRPHAIDVCDLEATKAAATRLKRLRQDSQYPLYPGAKWKVMRVTIREAS